jgi:predicted RNA-binding Zn ribbon-like protein
VTALPPLGPVTVEELVEFLNTRDVATGADALTGSARTNRWLHAHRLLPLDERLDDPDVLRARRARELIRTLATAMPAGRADLADVELLERAAARVRYTIGFGAEGTPRLQVLTRGADGVLARLLLAVLRAWVERTWSRVKVCRNPECRRVFVDTSRNRSRAWCDMGTCGNQAKARAWRRRHAH